MKRYHPILIFLHWLMAVMIIMALMAGKFLLAPMGLDDPAKVEGAMMHMTIGLVIGLLLIIRLLIRFFSVKPPHAKTGNMFFDRIGIITHWVIYLCVFGMVVSGLTMAIEGNFIGLVAGEAIDFLPADLHEWVARKLHGLFSTLLFLLVILHIAAVFYHQFYLRDGLFSRMWFGHRKS